MGRLERQRRDQGLGDPVVIRQHDGILEQPEGGAPGHGPWQHMAAEMGMAGGQHLGTRGTAHEYRATTMRIEDLCTQARATQKGAQPPAPSVRQVHGVGLPDRLERGVVGIVSQIRDRERLHLGAQRGEVGRGHLQLAGGGVLATGMECRHDHHPWTAAAGGSQQLAVELDHRGQERASADQRHRSGHGVSLATAVETVPALPSAGEDPFRSDPFGAIVEELRTRLVPIQPTGRRSAEGPMSGSQTPGAGETGAAPETGAPGAWQAPPPPQPVPGTAGFVYGDVPNRVFAYIIDAIVLAVISIVVAIILDIFFGPTVRIRDEQNLLNNLLAGNAVVETNFLRALIGVVVSLAVSAAYWIYMWTRMRGTVGMRALGMQVGNFPDGKTLTQDQAIRRWIALGGPLPLVQVLNQVPAIGGLISLAALGYFIYLLYSTAQSPTKQGFHDKFANSVVVKASRVA